MQILALIIGAMLFGQVVSKCDNELQCFKTKLFNFDSPGEGIYAVPQITSTNNTNKQLNILGYGDFDNNLYTDFIALFNSNASLAIFTWSTQSLNFVIANSNLNSSDCTPMSVFLYDLDANGLLDIVVWGTSNNQNCILPFVHQPDLTFIKGQPLTMQTTSNPFIIAYGTNNGANKVVGLLTYMNGQRTILQYNSANKNFTSISWIQVFPTGGSYANVAFADPHWNSFLDLTGDCRSDIAIVDQNNNIQIWINDGNIFKYQNSISNLGKFMSLSFSDMNYNGVVDMVIAFENKISIFYNVRQLADQNDFCKPEHTSVAFNTTAGVILEFQAGSTIQANMQIKDVNVDGYSDILVSLASGNTQTVTIYLSEQGKSFATNDQYKLPKTSFTKVVSVSLIDFLENGIMDFMVCTQNGIFSFYNNYLQQNLFFIKGYGASGVNASSGAQIIGASFYWINSVGDGYRTTFQTQISQTAYNALQTPFAYSGLGRANNYVESFTLGTNGDHNSWSPIIPNSQLAVYAPGAEPQDWGIRIYVLPTQSLIYVIIVSSIILTVFGIILAVLKCKNHRKRDEPLMEFIH